MTTTTSDIIDHLAGILPGSPLDKLRAQRSQARESAQKSYLALFEPASPGNVSRLERYAVATFVVGLHRQRIAHDFYSTTLHKLGRPDIADVIDAEIVRGAVEGPYGHYPEGPLSGEDVKSLEYKVFDGHAEILGSRLVAALHHAHLLVFHPRDADATALQRLLDAGWSTTDIITLSQLISFLSFQIRVAAGLRTLAGVIDQDQVNADRTAFFTGVLASGTL